MWLCGATTKDKAVGFCHHKEHVGYLSPNLVKQHDCIGKNCKYFNKYEDHPYWIRKQIVNAVKKYHKNSNSGHIRIEGEEYTTDNVDAMLSACKSMLSETGKVPEILYIKD